MQNQFMSRIRAIAVPVVLAGCMLSFLVSSNSQAGTGHLPGALNSGFARCSERTIAGNYAFSIEGTLLLPQGGTLLLRGISLAHYDGRGNMTQIDHVVTNGAAPQEEWTPGTGTYTVNPDCTGTQTIDIPGNPSSPVNLHFVIDQGGKEIRQVVDANAVAAIGSRVD